MPVIGKLFGRERDLGQPPAEPIWVGEVELGRALALEPVLAPPSPSHRRALLLVRLHGEPVGFVATALRPDGGADLGDLARQIADECRPAILAHLAADAEHHEAAETVTPMLPALAAAEPPATLARQLRSGLGSFCPARRQAETPGISVVLCTRNRPELARRALASLARLEYPDFEVLVVDNAPSDEATKEVFSADFASDERFRYVREPRPGLSRARNRGLAEARHGIVAFTDDDTRADARWLEGIARGVKRHAGVGCVTGLVPSAQLDTAAQQYFHDRVWWASSLVPTCYRAERAEGDSPLHPYRMGIYGTGANFAIDRELARSLGGFSELLGAGSPCRGGAEDLDMFVRVLKAGALISFEPSAIIWHRARPSNEELAEQLEEYGRGIPITGLKWLADPSTRRDVLVRIPGAFAYYLSLLWNRGYGGEASRAPMALVELRGTLFGPLAFARGWSALRAERRAGEA
ncbi:MAG: glycosyltransferase [Actinomycetota bacterium]|nr:glycosyltransferase [Actinomycetota bacterium]